MPSSSVFSSVFSFGFSSVFPCVFPCVFSCGLFLSVQALVTKKRNEKETGTGPFKVPSKIGGPFCEVRSVFSGIVEEVGTIIELQDSSDGRRFKIGAPLVTEDVQAGQSISVGGCCLTVVEHDQDWFSVELVHETLRKTTLGRLGQGSKVNLERSLRLSDRLGGHLVSGHVEAVAKVVSIETEGFSKVMTFELAGEFSPFFVEKGSVAIEGCSLTVWGVESIPLAPGAGSSASGKGKSDGEKLNAVGETKLVFKVALIPHTLSVTTLGTLNVGSDVNIETDIVARYVARWLEPSLIGHNLNHAALGVLALPN
jgi:riboflavin synthase